MDINEGRSLRPGQAAKFLSVSPSTLWGWVKTRPDFPRPIKLGPNTTVFIEGELIAYRKSLRVRQSDN